MSISFPDSAIDCRAVWSDGRRLLRRAALRHCPCIFCTTWRGWIPSTMVAARGVDGVSTRTLAHAFAARLRRRWRDFSRSHASSHRSIVDPRLMLSARFLPERSKGLPSALYLPAVISVVFDAGHLQFFEGLRGR